MDKVTVEIIVDIAGSILVLVLGVYALKSIITILKNDISESKECLRVEKEKNELLIKYLTNEIQFQNNANIRKITNETINSRLSR